MNNSDSKKAARLIQGIANGKAGLRFPVMTGTVVAGTVDAGNGVCSVQLSVSDDNKPTSGIVLNAVSLNSNGLILYPADGSNVWVCELDGPGKWGIVKCSDLVKCLITIGGSVLAIKDGLIQMNDGSLGGLTKTLELQSQINKLNTLVSHLVTVITGAAIDEPGSGSPSALQTALKLAIVADSVGDFSNIENTAIKQG